jgi:hypothetical protein
MTAKLIRLILVTVAAVALTCGLATAGEKMKTYEMGESGQVVMFLMTPQEIVAENAKNPRRTALKKPEATGPMMITYELAESGEVITFPMTAEEIEAAGKKAAEKAAKRSASEHEKVKNPNVVVEEYELCECGKIISFTRHKTEAEKLPVNRQ